jgi:hypothetical protein
MNKLQAMSNTELEDAIEEIIFGRTEKEFDSIYTNRWRFNRRKDEPDYGQWHQSAPYCTHAAACLEMEKTTIAVDNSGYVRNLSIVKWGNAVDPEEIAEWTSIYIQGVGDLFTATFRQRAEAAYITVHNSNQTGAPQLMKRIYEVEMEITKTYSVKVKVEGEYSGVGDPDIKKDAHQAADNMSIDGWDDKDTEFDIQGIIEIE